MFIFASEQLHVTSAAQRHQQAKQQPSKISQTCSCVNNWAAR